MKSQQFIDMTRGLIIIVFCGLLSSIIYLIYDKRHHLCNPVKLIYKETTYTKHDTITIIDTLVIMETRKLIPYPARRINYISGWSLETQPYELFKNGKTRDTIFKEVMEHY